MANDIPDIQNRPESLRVLAAQRRQYAHAKLAMTAQVLFVIVLPASMIAAVQINSDLRLLAGLVGVTASILDLAVFNPLKNRLRFNAASMQEFFDCAVLRLDWPKWKAERPDHEDIENLSHEADFTSLRDWYAPVVGMLPLYVGRVVCQRSNGRWDSALRRRFRVGLMALATLLIGGSVLVALYEDMRLQDLILTLLTPILPIALWAIRESRDQAEAADRADRLKRFGDQLWESVLNRSVGEDEATVQSRTLQDEIFEHRARSPLVFGWLYRLCRDRMERQMRYSAEEMARDAQDHGF